MAIQAPEREATIEDLERIEGKAEIVNGRIVTAPPHVAAVGVACNAIQASLHGYARELGVGRTFGSAVGFLCDLPHRKSFCPDGGFYVGPRAGMKFYPEPPIFAVEVRSEGDDGPAAEEQMEAKRADYFAAGTQVVWDVDLLSESAIVKKFVAPDAANPSASFTRGQLADAEPAVPGWTLAVNDLFESE